MRFTPAIVAALLLASGCVGNVEDLDPASPEPEPEPELEPDAGVTPTANDGKGLYTQGVHPMVIAKCSGGGCHTQTNNTPMYGFAVADPTASYDAVTSLPILVGTYTIGSAGLVSKIDAGHQNLTYSADERSKITAWLEQETLERNTGTTPPPIDPLAKLRDWSGCMSLDNFQAANMASAWGLLATSNNQRCANCHGGGAYAFLSGSGNATTFFATLTTQKDLLLKYFTVDSTGTIIINTGSFNSAGLTLEGHPRFNPTTNAGMTALKKFYDTTAARQLAATCDPARLPAP